MAKAQHEREYVGLTDLLRQMREDAGFTQRDLAKRIGKTQSWVFKTESSIRRMDITEFVLWAIACGVDPKDAFGQVLAHVTAKTRVKAKAPKKA